MISEIVEDIEKLKKEKNAVILAHYYAGINIIRPVPLDQHADGCHEHAAEEAGPGAEGGAEPAVKSEDDHRTAAAEPHGGDQRHIHLDIIQLRHVTGPEKEEHADADRDDAQEPHVLTLSQVLFDERQNDVLTERDGGAENPAVIRGNHGKGTNNL